MMATVLVLELLPPFWTARKGEQLQNKESDPQSNNNRHYFKLNKDLVPNYTVLNIN